MLMRVTLMGTGTSTGVPVIACDCTVCTSSDLRNRRMRTSCWVRTETTDLLIDSPPEMRLQCVREGVKRLDAVLLTHSHADHIFGLDDIRRFNFIQQAPMPVYGQAATLDDLRRVFAYVFDNAAQPGGGKPSLDLRPIKEPFRVGDLGIIPVPIMHGPLPVLGFRFGRFAYVTDVSDIPPSSMELLRDLDILVLGALRPRPHPTHFHFDRAVEVTQELSPRLTYFTHMTHDVDHDELERQLPDGIAPAYDGLSFDV